MITLYDIIEAINANLKPGIGTLILHRKFTVHPVFKIYKKFNYSLYLLKDNEKNLIDEVEFTENVQAEDINEVWSRCDKTYLIKLIDLISDKQFKEIQNVQQISNRIF